MRSHWLTCFPFLFFLLSLPPAGWSHLLQRCISPLFFSAHFDKSLVLPFFPVIFIPLFFLSLCPDFPHPYHRCLSLFSINCYSASTCFSSHSRHVQPCSASHPLLLSFLLLCLSPAWGGRQSSLCSPYDITQGRLQPLYATVQALAALDSASVDGRRRETLTSPHSASSSSSRALSLVSVTTQTPPPAWQIWDLIGSSLLHILCLTLLFVAYSWIELT